MVMSRLILGIHCVTLAGLLTATGVAAQTRSAASRPASLLFVSNEGSRDVTVVRLPDLSVAATIPLRERPRGIQPSADRRRVYVALSDSIPTVQSPGDAIAVIDVASRKVIARYAGGTDPEQFAVTPNGATLYAANEDAGTASAIDLRTGKVSETMAVGIEPEGVAVSPDGRWIYVTAETSNTVSVIDTRSDRVVASFLVDVRPRAATFAPDGKRAYVSAEIGGSVRVVDTRGHDVITTIALGDG